MKVFVYESESSVGYGPEIHIVIAENRKNADEAIERNSGYPVHVFKVEEKELVPNTTIFAGVVHERLDEHRYE